MTFSSWSLRSVAAGLAAVAIALATLACATAQNYLGAAGPRYEGHYAIAGADQRSPAPAASLRVVTFNIQFALHVDRALALLESDDALRDPDLLLLQEMDAASVERIAKQLRLNYVCFPSAIHPKTHRQFGTAILSAWPLAEARKIVLPHSSVGTGVRRVVTTATMQRDGLRIRVYAVHLPAPAAVSPDNRKEQVDIIAADAATSSDPVVIAGDFNSRKAASWFAKAGFLWLTDRLPGTSHGFGRWWSFDHVLVRGLRPAGQTPAAGVVDPTGASDHRAVWVRIQPDPRS